jgi:FKBP-type peptidyl-prolyl cis-trans isomerase FkpA
MICQKGISPGGSGGCHFRHPQGAGWENPKSSERDVLNGITEMAKSTVLITTLIFVASLAPAQRDAHKRPLTVPRGASLSSMSGPTRVTGEGTTTPSGLTYWDIRIGEGAAVTKGKAVKIHYTGWLETGKKFDSSVESRHPVAFIPGAGQVIKGWDEGVLGMKMGGKRQLRIPPGLAYGPRGSELVPPNSTLICDIEVIGVQ